MVASKSVTGAALGGRAGAGGGFDLGGGADTGGARNWTVASGSSSGGGTGGGAAWAVEAPHSLQNLAPRMLSVPHLAQARPASATGAGLCIGANSACPQPLQNLALSPFSVAHFGQTRVMVGLSEQCHFGSGRSYLPTLKLLKARVCTRRRSCGRASGAIMVWVAAASRKMDLLSATSRVTKRREATFGLA